MNNFILSEFDCGCGCGKNNMDQDFLNRLDLAADYSEEQAGYNIPYVISSGSRCWQHNKDVGSTSMNHVEGKAADIKYESNTILMYIMAGLVMAGFKRIGINREYNFVHVDSMDKTTSLWGYG